MDVAQYNRKAWDHQVEQGNRWTIPVSEAVISEARAGRWHVVLTPQKPVPSSWFPKLAGLKVLGLASGGGQQAPIMAAAGAHVTVLDNSPKQLEQDQFVARRDGLVITSILGDMRDLSRFAPESFDLVFNPCSMSFISEAHTVFEQVHHVLKPNGRLLCGFTNPVRFIFDEEELSKRKLLIKHKLPYKDSTHLSSEDLEKLRLANEPFICSHSLEDLFAGQLKAGFTITDMYEDTDDECLLSEYLPSYFATRAEKC